MSPTPFDPGEPKLRLVRPPIIEAVLDIDCDLPPGLDLASVEARARAALPGYPKFQRRIRAEAELDFQEEQANATPVSRQLMSLLFGQEDGKQLVQFRAQGFSFNRLAPYTTLDDYLPEVERTWNIFVALTAPVQVRAVRLRNVNRFLLSEGDGPVELNDYFSLGPRLTDEHRFSLNSFLHQYSVTDKETDDRASVILTMQPPEESAWPIVFDITAEGDADAPLTDWPWIAARIATLRSLKNYLFRHTLTPRCLELFQNP